MKVEWPEHERSIIINKMMDISANLENYQGVIVITKNAACQPSWVWIGPPQNFSAVDAIALTDIVHEVTLKELTGKFIDSPMRDNDDEDTV